MHRLAPLALACLLLAGCSGSPAAEDAPAATTTSTGLGAAANNTTAPPLPPATVDLSGCSQMHTFFPFPAQAIVPSLPPGFAPVTDASGQMVDVFLNVGVCDGGWAVLDGVNVTLDAPAEMQIYLPVAPPSELRDPAATLDLVPIVAYTDQPAVLALLLNWSQGGPFGEASFSALQSTPAGAAQSDRVAVDAGTETYEVGTVVQVAAGPTFEALYQVWLVDQGGGLVGGLRVTVTGGENVGGGTASYQSASTNGPLFAGPPAWPGTAHRVDGAAVHVEHFLTSDAQG